MNQFIFLIFLLLVLFFIHIQIYNFFFIFIGNAILKCFTEISELTENLTWSCFKGLPRQNGIRNAIDNYGLDITVGK